MLPPYRTDSLFGCQTGSLFDCQFHPEKQFLTTLWRYDYYATWFFQPIVIGKQGRREIAGRQFFVTWFLGKPTCNMRWAKGKG